MSCNCLGIDYSFEKQKMLADSYYKETGEVCVVYEFSKNKYRWMLQKYTAQGIIVLYETKNKDQ